MPSVPRKDSDQRSVLSTRPAQVRPYSLVRKGGRIWMFVVWDVLVLLLVEFLFNNTEFDTVQSWFSSASAFKHEWMRYENDFYANLVYAVLNVPFLLLMNSVVFQIVTSTPRLPRRETPRWRLQETRVRRDALPTGYNRAGMIGRFLTPSERHQVRLALDEEKLWTDEGLGSRWVLVDDARSRELLEMAPSSELNNETLRCELRKRTAPTTMATRGSACCGCLDGGSGPKAEAHFTREEFGRFQLRPAPIGDNSYVVVRPLRWRRLEQPRGERMDRNDQASVAFHSLKARLLGKLGSGSVAVLTRAELDSCALPPLSLTPPGYLELESGVYVEPEDGPDRLYRPVDPWAHRQAPWWRWPTALRTAAYERLVERRKDATVVGDTLSAATSGVVSMGQASMSVTAGALIVATSPIVGAARVVQRAFRNRRR